VTVQYGCCREVGLKSEPRMRTRTLLIPAHDADSVVPTPEDLCQQDAFEWVVQDCTVLYCSALHPKHSSEKQPGMVMGMPQGYSCLCIRKWSNEYITRSLLTTTKDSKTTGTKTART